MTTKRTDAQRLPGEAEEQPKPSAASLYDGARLVHDRITGKPGWVWDRRLSDDELVALTK